MSTATRSPLRVMMLLLFASLVLNTGVGAQAAEGPVAASSFQASQEALRLQTEGRFGDAVTLLLDAVTSCGPDDAGYECRALAWYTLGYIHVAQGDSGSTQARVALLEEAAGAYQEVLAESDTHRETLSNLALVYRHLAELDTTRAAVDRWGMFVQDVLERVPDIGVEVRVDFGDYYRHTGQWQAAVDEYVRAAAAYPEDPLPRRRMVALFEVAPAELVSKLYEILSQSPDWEFGFPDVARSGYEVVVRRAPPSARPISTAACYRWLWLLSSTNTISREALARVGGSWLSSAIVELAAFMSDPNRLPEHDIWMRVEAGRESIMAFALALGRRAVDRGDPGLAARYWSAGLDVDLSAPNAIELGRELAGVYYRHPQTESLGLSMKTLEEQLFVDKSAAYDRADKREIQRLHTTLGLIYAEREVWRSGDAANAIFQLERAIDVAATRAEAEGFEQPLPYLNRRLADGYAATGRSAKAARQYARAAAAYLDVDQLDAATELTVRASGIYAAISSAPEATTQYLGNLIQLRARPAGDSVVLVAGGGGGFGPGNCGRIAEILVATDRGLVSPEFVDRQHFKLRADCVLAGRDRVALGYDAANVLREAIDNEVTLIGASDYGRVEQLKGAVAWSLGVLPFPGHIDSEVTRQHGDGGLALTMVDRDQPGFVFFGQQTALQVDIAPLLRNTGVRMQVDEFGNVTLIGALSDSSIVSEIRSVAGVRSVVVREF